MTRASRRPSSFSKTASGNKTHRGHRTMQKQHFISTPFLSSLPLMPLPAEMRVWDQQSVALGIPDPVLMENAARAALSVLLKELGSVAGRDIALFMGPGNNGGDAACLARHLMD